MKLPTKSSAKKKAWKAFSQWVRRSNMNDLGNVTCYTCGKVLFWKQAQAGHGVPGRNNSVLFMEEVVKPQCAGCNIFGRGKQSVFTMKLIQELGMKKYEALIALSNQITQYKLVDYQEIEKKYKERLFDS